MNQLGNQLIDIDLQQPQVQQQQQQDHHNIQRYFHN
jgi:hypothetical protein